MGFFAVTFEAFLMAGKLSASFARSGWCLLFLAVFQNLTVQAEVFSQTLTNVQNAYLAARSNQMAFPAQAEPAWRLAKACFDLAEYATNDQRRASLAEEGINAAKSCTEREPANAAGHFYLALNLGQLARTRTLSALSLIRQMEKELLRAIELDAHLDRAGPDRSLGLLYLDAPSWPASIGSRKKAREHLERAVALEPEYPDNHLSLLEAYVRWGDTKGLKAGIARYRKLVPEAKKKLTGTEWEQAWRDWEERWESIQQHGLKE